MPGTPLELEDGRSQTVDCLIWAIGREPATDNFNLAATGIVVVQMLFRLVVKQAFGEATACGHGHRGQFDGASAEPQAREQYGDDSVKVYKSSFTAMYTAVTSHRQPGLLLNKRSERRRPAATATGVSSTAPVLSPTA
jgi:glutathione reductase (NADPH)